jgi:hypothetical protein
MAAQTLYVVACGGTDDGTDVPANGIVKPTEDALIDDMPIRITALVSGWGEETWEGRLNLPRKASKKHLHSS